MDKPCGYDVPFLTEVDPRYSCPICLLVLKEPMQTACGHRFCQSCIKRVYVTNNVLTCPVDKQYSRVNQMFMDVAINREILSLSIRCPKTEDGCTWTGELRDLTKHKDLCRREEIKCKACEKNVVRSDMESHMTECPSREVTCQHCEAEVIYKNLTNHKASCPRTVITCETCGEVDLPREELPKHLDPLNGNCLKVVVTCPFKIFGCKYKAERRLMLEHGACAEIQREHLDLCRKKTEELDNKIAKLTEKLEGVDRKCDNLVPRVRNNEQRHTDINRSLVERNVTGRMHWRVKLNVRRRGQYTSPVLYTGCPGYKVQMVLDLDGHRENNVRYCSFYMCLLAGDYDEQLTFPFNATCVITLYDQTNGIGPRKLNSVEALVVREVPRVLRPHHSHDRIYKRGLTQYFKKNDLIGAGSRYLRHGCLSMEISVLHCYYPPPEVLTSSAGSFCPLVAQVHPLNPCLGSALVNSSPTRAFVVSAQSSTSAPRPTTPLQITNGS